MEIGQNFTKWCKTLNSKANVNIFGEFWECTKGIGYFIPSKVPFLNAQSWAFWPKSPKVPMTSKTTIFGCILRILMLRILATLTVSCCTDICEYFLS